MSGERGMATVAICTWNRASVLARTLDQLTRLRVPRGMTWELLVVNNNCTDATDETCRAFDGRLPIRILHERTPGQSHARNLAMQEAKGAYIAWTDDDVLVDGGWLEALLDAFTAYNADWVFGASEPHWPAEVPSWYSPRMRGYFAVLDYGPTAMVIDDYDRPFYGLNFAGRPEAHRSLGGFRTDLGLQENRSGGGEDIDMFERAMQAGMKIVYTPDARVRHIIPPERARKAYHRKRQFVASSDYYAHLGEMFPRSRSPWLLGLPRFFFGNAARDALAYVRSSARLTAGDQFHHELQLLRFVALAGQAARHRFQRP